MTTETIVGIAAGSFTAASLIPQVIRTFRTKDVSGISWFMFVVLLAGNGLWAWYGFLISSLPVIITNSFSFILDIVMLVLKIRYGKNKAPR